MRVKLLHKSLTTIQTNKTITTTNPTMRKTVKSPTSKEGTPKDRNLSHWEDNLVINEICLMIHILIYIYKWY